MMISKADIAAFCRDVVYGKVKEGGKKMMLKKKDWQCVGFLH